jgi:hypothetical protein
MSATEPEILVTAERTAYTPTDSIIISVVNNHGASVFTTDHQTCCTIIGLRLQTADGWIPVGNCMMMIASRIVEIHAGATMRVTLAPGAGMLRAKPWPPGTYRAALRYTLSPHGAEESRTLESAEFVVA